MDPTVLTVGLVMALPSGAGPSSGHVRPLPALAIARRGDLACHSGL